MREDPRAAFDGPSERALSSAGIAMDPPSSIYVSQLSRRGLARRRARLRRRTPQHLLLGASAVLALATVLERALG
jgi:hypothetical protein